jgi:hypothetical protein
MVFNVWSVKICDRDWYYLNVWWYQMTQQNHNKWQRRD